MRLRQTPHAAMRGHSKYAYSPIMRIAAQTREAKYFAQAHLSAAYYERGKLTRSTTDLTSAIEAGDAELGFAETRENKHIAQAHLCTADPHRGTLTRSTMNLTRAIDTGAP